MREEKEKQRKKRQAGTRGHIRKRGEKYFVSYSVHGKRCDEVAGTTMAQAKRLLTQRLHEADSGVVRTSRPTSFEEFVEVWKRDHVQIEQLKRSTVVAYESMLDEHLLPVFGKQRLDRITNAQIRRFFLEKQAEKSGKTKKPLSKKTLLNCLRLLKSILNFAVATTTLIKSPAMGVKLPRPDHREMDFLRPDEVKPFLDAVESEQMRCFFTTAILTGMRRGELLALRWRDIDWPGKVIRIRQALSFDEISTPKTEKSRRNIQVGDQLLRVLKEHKLRCGNRSELVFSTLKGGLLDPDNLVKRHFEPALRKAGITRHIRLHDLRHSFASILINEGANLKFVSEQLGHSSIVITLDRYSHLIAERHGDTVSKLETLLLGESVAAQK